MPHRSTPSRPRPGQRFIGCAVAITLSSCASGVRITAPPDAGPPDLADPRPPSPIEKVDLLFVIENASSMGAMQVAFQAALGRFFASFADAVATDLLYADLQIGVVTTDYGAGDVGAPGGDPSPGGQRAELQALGAAADPSCLRPTGNVPFVRYQFAFADGPTNLPPGQNLLATLTCMTSVGTAGCGFTQPLESAYQALHLATTPTNAGFLRPDALLAVIFLTRKDDGSAPPTAQFFDSARTSDDGYEDIYRQTEYALVCGTPPAPLPYGASGGPLQNCQGAPNPTASPALAFDLSRYVDFFTRPISEGGVKTDPSEVILAAIDAPSTPFEIVLSDPGTIGGMDYVACEPLDGNAMPHPCVPLLQRSCHSATHPALFGTPAVRLNTVVSAVANHALFSICDDDDDDALARIAALVIQRMQAGRTN